MSAASSLGSVELRRDNGTEFVGSRKGNVPRELIAFEAYCKWLRRCQLHGRVVHGGDQIDWLEAELELADLWSELTAEDVDQLFDEIHSSPLVPSHDRTSLRAYYKSISTTNQSFEQSERNWHEAELEEKTLLFVQRFHRFLSRRRRAPSRFGLAIHRN